MVTLRIGPASVIGASALLTVSLAAAPLYVSSSATAALQVGLSRTCATDVGLVLQMPATANPALDNKLAELLRPVGHLEQPIVTTVASAQFTVKGGDGVVYSALLSSRDGQDAELHIDPAIAVGQFVVQDTSQKRVGFAVGSSIVLPTRVSRLAGGATIPPVQLTLSRVVGDIPYSPEQSYWCGFRGALRPTAAGDPPPLLLFMNRDQMVKAARSLTVFKGWEVRVHPAGLTRHDAETLVEEFHRIVAETADDISGAYENEAAAGYSFRRSQAAEPQLTVLVRRANTVSDVVAKTVEPIRLSGAAASLLLLIGAGVLIARQRRRDLRLRVIRGESPWSMMSKTVLTEAPLVVIGAAIGFGLSMLAVVTLGPSSLLETTPVRSAAVLSVFAAMLAGIVVAGACAFTIHRSVDAVARRRHRHVPYEWTLAALIYLSYHRLNRLGGVQLVGADAVGGDLLAQAFPLILLVVPLIVVARPFVALLRRSRRWGTRLATPVWLGVRRVAGEPVISTVIVLTTALAFGAFVVSTAMTASAKQLLVDKSQTFIGADEEISVSRPDPLPAGLEATTVLRVDAKIGDVSVDILGVDPETFAAIVRMRADATSAPLQKVLDSIRDDDANGASSPLLAIVVAGTLPSGDLVTTAREHLSVKVVARARFFAGQHNGAVLVVVDSHALQATGIGAAPEVWLRNPPANAASRLTAAGFIVFGTPRRPEDVLSVVSFLAVQWSYAALRAFGAMIGLVAILVQFVVLDSRRKARKAAVVLTRAMGMRGRDDTIASTTEIIVPVLTGFVLAVVLGVAMLQIAVPKLDTLRNLPPPARVVLDTSALWLAASAGVMITVILAVYDAARNRASDPMESMRDGT